MGGCLSVSISMSCDQTLNQVCHCLSEKTNYIHKLEENVKTLQNDTQELMDLRDDLLTRLFLEEEQGQRRLATVQRWFSNVETIQSQVNDLVIAGATEISSSFKSKFDYGKRVSKKIKEVQVLKSRGDFRVMSQRVPIPKVEERLIQPAVGLVTMVENVCSSLLKDEVGTLGLYGMGGVGKTTLLSQINNSFVDTDDFDLVIWVVVSKDPQIESIQETILRRLGRCNEEWKHRKEDEKASEIKHILKSKRYMLLLDDIWSKLDIQKIGIPLPTRTNRCKVVFTTRSKEVCSEMQVDVEIEVKCLASDEAWDLFRMRVTDTTLNCHPDIPRVARVITQKCYGLPLALNVIGETMASRRTIQEWSHARDVLITSFASEFSCMQDKILPILKFSYDNLDEELLRRCLQYCALFPEDYEIEKEELVEYWICEGIIDGSKDRGRATNYGFEIIGTLVRACLLMEYEHTEYLKMHDMVREMALWIAADLGNKESFIVKAGVRLSHVPEVKDWSVVQKMSLMENQIERINTSPCGTTTLVTLFLQNNNLVNISEQFFKYMTELKVLDLSSNESLTEVPEISWLVSLRYLNLSSTGIKMFPVGIKELRKLIHVDLEYTHKLETVDGISKLESLQVLRLFESNVHLSGLVQELQFLKHLKLLTLTLKDASMMERLLNIPSLAKFMRYLSLDKCIPKSIRISLMAVSSDLRCHEMTSPDIPNMPIDRRQKYMTSADPMCFRSLTCADIVNCEGLRDLTWLIYAPSLTSLRVEMSFQIEEIISKEKLMKTENEELKCAKPFPKLETLSLLFLDAVKSIYWSPLPFPALKVLKILRCPKLMKLPLNSESAKGCDLVIDAYRRWLLEIEWEDEATKNRFCPH